MPTHVQAILLGLLQGATELFPVSSVGHGVLVPSLLHWGINQASASFLPFLVVLHLGTALGLLLYFLNDWIDAFRHLRILWLLIIGTVPAGIIGLVLNKPLTALFASPLVAAVFLLVNGGMLYLGDRRRAVSGAKSIEHLRAGQAFWIGIWQAAALIPGISRSGATLVAGLRQGLREEEAARFAFLLATPVIAGAGLLEVPKLLHDRGQGILSTAAMGGVVAGLAAVLSTAILMRYFKQREVQALRPFAIYCWIAGAVSLVLLAVGL
ncbi:MAG TPA: undecaprenyl-diphosphate phosphatase [Bacillota bacterium]|nr:undecaprenyl-diphosphate phosphatase [Bacillota bacterium]